MNSGDDRKSGDLHTIKRKITLKEKIQQLKKQRRNFGIVDPSNITSKLIEFLCDKSNNLPLDYHTICSKISTEDQYNLLIKNLLVQFSALNLIELKNYSNESEKNFHIASVDFNNLKNFNVSQDKKTDEGAIETNKIKLSSAKPAKKTTDSLISNSKTSDDVECILSLQSAKEKENKKISEEILHLLSKPTAKELSLFEQFKSATGHVQEFCQYGVRDECMRVNNFKIPCSKLHFLKIIQKHTDESLGDCSFLNTCFHMESCKYVHYKVEVKTTADTSRNENKDPNQTGNNSSTNIIKTIASATEQPFKRVLFPAQWIRCDLRFFDMSMLGKFAVVMADPPWDIHMELPYGTMSDDEMRNLNIPCIQDEGLIFLWVTGRAMELGRECLQLWGYERCDELIWVKTNQLQRIIRTGRTGHWINHGKEHCLVGVKGNPKNLNRGLDCDVIVAEVRATSHKPDEIYGIIERLSPGSRKIELFGRQHNTQPNWVTLGNQLGDIRLVDPQLVQSYTERHPEDAHLVKTGEEETK